MEARPGGVQHTDNGNSHATRKNREVRRIHADFAAIHFAVAGDHSVCWSVPHVHSEIPYLRSHERAEFDKCAGVEEYLDPFPHRQLAARVLLGDFLVSAHPGDGGFCLRQFGEQPLNPVRSSNKRIHMGSFSSFE